MIVTGCQRSGTMTCAKIFGINHEVVFVPGVKLEILKNRKIASESSWLAQPFVNYLNSIHKIIHIVRHPLAVVNSLLGIGFWEYSEHEPYRNFVERYLPIPEDYSSLEKSLYYWFEWNSSLLSYPRIQIEAISNAPQLNSRPRGNLQSWDDIPNGKLKERVRNLADEVGYG